MAQKFLSPGVFTTEIDLSFLAAGVAGIGAVIIGRTPKGPAFVPTIVNGLPDFNNIFGGPKGVEPNHQMTYAAKNYLKNGGTLTVVRTLGHVDGSNITNGYTVGSITAITDLAASGSVMAVLHHSGTVSNLSVVGVPVDANNFVVRIGATFAATASFLTSSANYIEKVLNTDPTKYSSVGHYVYRALSYAKPAASASWSTAQISGALSAFTRDFEGGVTPWIKSQAVGGIDFNLFRFNTKAHGQATNNELKVTISNIKPSPSPLATPYGTFDIYVRQFSDSDQRQVIVDSFVGCSMDPNSLSYIARKIGNSVELFDTTQRKFIATGDFPSKSKHIYVEMSTEAQAPTDALPWGHRGLAKETFVSASSLPSVPYTINQIDRNGNQDANIHWGISFVSGGIDDRMRAFPNNISTLTASDADFSMTFLTSSYTAGKRTWQYDPSLAAANQLSPIYASASLYKFSVPFLGGFDGLDLRVDNPFYLTNVADETDVGVVSLKRGIDTVSNPDAFDFNIAALPSIHNLKVTDYARAMVNSRMDAMFVMDVTGSSVAEVVGNLKNRELDDNYTACYYPDLKLDDKTNARVLRVAPSVAILGAIAYSDRVGQVFFAPAGMNRGGLSAFDIVDVQDRLTFQDRNDLYDNRINPIATFPAEGIVVFGQKTLQVKASALDRINVRRLLIFAKKTIAGAAKLLLFEPNNPQTYQRFTNTVNPILEKIRQDQGIDRFRVVMDATTNTPDLVDRNIMTGKIFLQPTKSAEFIDLSFIITNAGVSFGE